jgi:hypothetical protein
MKVEWLAPELVHGTTPNWKYAEPPCCGGILAPSRSIVIVIDGRQGRLTFRVASSFWDFDDLLFAFYEGGREKLIR